jgi:branched-subunit amino acid aminotransferase/4-amino-4-deoxychorismate lyase
VTAGPGIPLDDRGLTLGDGLFETLLARDGVLTAVDAHLRRRTSPPPAP